MTRFFLHITLFLVLVWASITYVISEPFDEICMEGVLSAEQAQVLNLMKWGHCPSYRNGECRAEENDRVFVGQCSEASKFLWRPKKWLRVLQGGDFPWQY